MIIPSNDFINKFKECNGAMSVCEAIALYNIVFSECPKGDHLELGSHKGKSSFVIAKAIPNNSHFYMVEPEFKDSKWQDSVANLVSEVKDEGLHFEASYSLEEIPKYNDLAFCFVDSGVHDDMVMDEAQMLEDRMKRGGVIAFHDYQNQFTAVERAYEYLKSTGKYESIFIDWPRIFDYVRENNLEENNTSWHEKGSEEFPKFIGALRRK